MTLATSRTPLRVRWDWFRAWLDAGPWLRPVAAEDRCYMGAPIGYQCRREAVGLWCRKHGREV